jgi:multimeric flavodoxin WrbA
MKIVEICGSPRSKGNTEYIMDLCEQELNNIYKDEIAFERINLYDYQLDWCKGCRICFDISEEKCPNKDGLLMIKQKMEEADIILIGSPVYIEDVSATMKNWMDRMAFNCHRPFLLGKSIYVFTTSAAKASKHAAKTIERGIVSWGGNVKYSDNYITGAIIKEKKGNLQKLTINKRMKYILEVNQRQDISLFSLIGFGIQKRYWIKDKHSVDYEYWMKMNWFDTDCIYYKAVKVNKLKKITAILISKLVERYII